MISVQGLRKRFGPRTALDGLDLEVAPGTVHGLLGPNGAGKGGHSGGMRRRLDLAAGMITAPPVLFLDEPTTGLDPRSRTEVWTAVRALVAGGTTVLLTTQYLDEADQLAGRITVVDAGRAVATGTPADVKATVGGARIDVVVRDVADLPAVRALVAGATGTAADADPDTRRVGAPVRDRVAVFPLTVRAWRRLGR
jgi:ABC-2 type transport system ATP-binding protein